MKAQSKFLHLVMALGIATVADSAWAAEKARRVATHDEAGSTHAAILSVAPWEEYVDSLQPAFEMTPQKALELALPTTATEEERMLKAFGLALSLAGKTDTGSATNTLTTTSATTSSIAGVAEPVTNTTSSISDSSTATSTEGSGDLSQVPTRTFTQNLPDLAINPADTVAKDPLLLYQTATAIFQEVKLLSRTLRDTAMRDNYEPYLVRAQVTVMPRAHHAPYDTYTTLSFFTGTNIPSTEPDPKDPNQNKLDFRVAEQRMYDQGNVPSPIVVPVLVTDHLEGRLHSRTSESLKEFALAFLALQSTGIGGNLNAKSNEIRSLLATDLNSLLSVARLNDNTLRVRFGAANSAVSSHAMVAQTHNITFLLLVPTAQVTDKLATVRFVSRTSFVDADSGKELPLPGYFKYYRQIRATMRRFETRYKIKFKSFREIRQPAGDLFLAVGFNDRVTFERKLREVIADFDQVDKYRLLSLTDGLWVEAVNGQSSFHWHSGLFEVPKIDKPCLPSQGAILMDDEKQSARITLLDGKHLRKDDLAVTLTFKSGDSDVTLRPSAIGISEVKTQLTLTFPSPSLWPPALPAGTARTFNLDLGTLHQCNQNQVPGVNLVHSKKSDSEAKTKAFQLTMVANAKLVRANEHGEGSVHVLVDKVPGNKDPVEGRYVLKIEGADSNPTVTSGQPANCLDVVGEVKAVPCSITIGIKNLPADPCQEPKVTVKLVRVLDDKPADAAAATWLVAQPVRGKTCHSQ